MAILRSPLPEEKPGHYGEVAAFRAIAALPIDDLEIWMNVELPQTPEIDLILNHRLFGAYIIEIKAYRIDEIQSYTPDKLIGADGRISQHPVKQVKDAEYKLRSYLSRHAGNHRVPFFQKSVLWPRITREEWLMRFPHPVVRDQADFMLFADDLRDPGTLLRALRHVTEHPLGVAIPEKVRCDQPGMAVLRRLTDFESEISAIAPGEYTNPDLLTVQERQELLSGKLRFKDRLTKYSLDEAHSVIFRGYPGSGKTTALRELAVLHAEAGKSVLYVCFNKVLAAKVKQEIDELLSNRGVSRSVVTVADQYQLMKSSFPGLITNPEQKGKWVIDAKRITQDFDIATYETVLVDESQDIDGEFLDVLQLLRSEDSSIFLAYGDKQQIYNLDRYKDGMSTQLAEIIKVSKLAQFNRPFRTSTSTQLICASVSDFFPDEEAAAKWLKDRYRSGPGAISALAPTLEFDSDFSVDQSLIVEDCKSSEYSISKMLELVDHLVEASANTYGEVNGLILFDRPTSANYEVVVKHLKESGIPFFDQVLKANRRKVPEKHQVVLSTFRQVRGMTATHTLVLDASEIENASISEKIQMQRNLYNIALSRAKQVTVVYSGTTHDDVHRPRICNFIERGISALSEEMS